MKFLPQDRYIRGRLLATGISLIPFGFLGHVETPWWLIVLVAASFMALQVMIGYYIRESENLEKGFDRLREHQEELDRKNKPSGDASDFDKPITMHMALQHPESGSIERAMIVAEPNFALILNSVITQHLADHVSMRSEDD